MPKNVKENPLGFLKIQFFAKHQKLNGGPLRTLKTFERSFQSQNNEALKNLVQV